MSALNPPAIGPITLEPNAIRLVLFGMPDAGKSSLLGALAQAAHTQTRTLHGHLSDLSNGLTDLRRRVYDDRQHDTQREISPYPIRFIPFGKENTAGHQAVLYDCDGQAVNQLLTKQKNLDAHGSSALVDAIRQADALVLLIDASATYEQLADDFREFVRFLKTLELYRTRRHEVGGWPIYLVLTKCDLLARDPISRSMWLARIEEKEKAVAAQFNDFLEADDEEGPPSEYLAFGSLDVQVRAVGVARPTLTDSEGNAREPFGVAELFHDAIITAQRYKLRSQKARQRLAWTVAGAGGLLATMATVAALLVATPTGPEPQLGLSTKVEMVQASEGATAAARLSGKALDRRVRELLELKNDADFDKLPDKQKNYINLRIEEAQAYIRFRDEVDIILPSKAHTLEELTQYEGRLTKLSVPSDYRGQWQQTEAVQRRERMLTVEIPALKEAVGKLTTYYQTLNTRVRTLVQTSELTPDWENKVATLISDAEKSRPFSKTDPVQGTAYQFDDVNLAETDWQKQLTRLTQLRDLATALGLLGNGSQAPLAFSEPPTGTNIAELSTKRWQQLKTAYPDYQTWKTSNLPDAIQPEIQRRLRRSVEQANRDGQRVLLDRLKAINQGGAEVAADWPRVADYLSSPTLQDWRELTTFVAKLYEPNVDDPVQQTMIFLKQPSVELEAKTITIRIPDSYLVKPAGDFVMVHRRTDGTTTQLVFKPSGEDRNGQIKIYTFIPAKETKITYKAGEPFYAELPLKKADRDMKFTWSTARTTSYQFERLHREPHLHDAKLTNIDGLPAEGVIVSIDGKFPTVPPLVPTVR